ncbi:thiol:disulfide interchange protein [Roseivivax halodurans JCM 10272]|uniref:Thiol:disulfide interchange protein n=1 Tax=Roseivivax halodurans JCM 10272 TaxID=1449350 RepID=X7EF31_9RHOB|nr:DsbE family thiol:disulfide interchange protein [Roseivivax halodurans]ETX14699.1 thiol:disulfide interchange protein [Roseivivax halodurans JCM 10272]
MLVPPLVFAAFAALAYFGMYRADPDSLPSTRVNKPAPAITPEGLEGYPAVGQQMLADGDVTLVNFWASWCPPCRAEHPQLLDYAAEGLDIVGVNFKDQSNAALTYLRDEQNPFAAVAFDPRGRTAIDWGVTAPPETFIIDGEGTVIFRFQGPLVGSDFEQRFVPALEEAMAGDG